MTDKLANEKARTAARLLTQSRLAHGQFSGFDADLRPRGVSDAYQVQDEVHALLQAAGRGDEAGYKIGCTTPIMQRYLGIDSPAAGRMFATTVFEHTGTFEQPGPAQFGVECEIAVRLGADLPPQDGGYSRAETLDAVAECMVAIEVVEDRYVDYGSLDTLTLIADDFFHAGAVVGGTAIGLDPDDLPGVRARMIIDGVEVGAGIGTDVMEHPIDALAWLANHTSARGDTLHRGSVVLLGSLVETKWVDPGAYVRVDSVELGTAEAVFP